MPTEYDNIDIIGTTHENSSNFVEEMMNKYYHKQEVSTVKYLLSKMNLTNFHSVIDLGCSIGTWFDDFKKFGFQKIIGIDISKERVDKAKERGYDETYVCNAYELPFEDDNQTCVISNDVFVHVLQDDDKLKILNEIYRVLQKNGIFLFNFVNARGFSYHKNQTVSYCRYCTLPTILNLVNQTKFITENIIPSYFTIPRIGSNPRFVSLSSNIIFPTVDKILKKLNYVSAAKVIYLGLRK